MVVSFLVAELQRSSSTTEVCIDISCPNNVFGISNDDCETCKNVKGADVRIKLFLSVLLVVGDRKSVV